MLEEQSSFTPSPHPLMGTGEIVVFDLETTGLRSAEDEITQIAAVRLGGWEMKAIDSFCTYVNPGRPIPLLASKITKITDKDVADAPKPIDALRQLGQFAEGATLFGHDVYRFDFKFINKHINETNSDIISTHFLDTMDIVQLIWPDFSRLDHGLDEIAIRLNAPIPDKQRHKADGDALLLARVFQRIQTLPDLDYIAASVPVHDALLPSPPSDLDAN